MKNITHLFQHELVPHTVLTYYTRPEAGTSDNYIELSQVDEDGNMINAHPLTLSGSISLADCFKNTHAISSRYTACNKTLPTTVLHIDGSAGGDITWYTKPKKVYLHFTESSKIPSGMAYIPGLVWQGNMQRLYLFALKDGKRPTDATPLFHAPFLNVNDSGKVCMGTTSLNSLHNLSMIPFMAQWEKLFFGSVFSHTLNATPTKKDCGALWKGLIKTGKHFPTDQLIITKKTLQNIL